MFCGGGLLRTVGKEKKVAAAAAAAAAAVSGKAASSSAGRRRKKTATAQAASVIDEDSAHIIHATDSTRTRFDGEVSHPSYGGAAAGARGRRSQRSDEEVLRVAERMQRRDLTGEVPVASFAYEILKAHPSVRQMGLRERMAFLCDRWERLRKEERQAYLDDPLKGLL
ncbi:uncharacterized protein Tco025E_00165 [Trypanosoma conorhini]|uniref:Uncharacterized protein n=1 Tax=Trypanosoma conorhini TaxID=83891 RepID=A0A422QCB1_9TRYP|nr:uncharacterized protein Tco025E_00165 [Trypanosoma conorhini]RNF27604.1 hypothetical protein Tco025E_00165 [Trypanosoma conorhini]